MNNTWGANIWHAFWMQRCRTFGICVNMLVHGVEGKEREGGQRACREPGRHEAGRNKGRGGGYVRVGMGRPLHGGIERSQTYTGNRRDMLRSIAPRAGVIALLRELKRGVCILVLLWRWLQGASMHTAKYSLVAGLPRMEELC
jgi:hypothetical protein